jgi:hypothetical protein
MKRDLRDEVENGAESFLARPFIAGINAGVALVAI